jgi:hypothetical protein
MSCENELKSLFDDALNGQVDGMFKTKITTLITNFPELERFTCRDENLVIDFKLWKSVMKNDEYILANYGCVYDGRNYSCAVTNYGSLFTRDDTCNLNTVEDVLRREGFRVYNLKLFFKSLVTIFKQGKTAVNEDKVKHIVFMLRIIDGIISRHDSQALSISKKNKLLQENDRLRQENLKLKEEMDSIHLIDAIADRLSQSIKEENLKLEKELEEMDEGNLKLKKELEEMDDVYFDNKHLSQEIKEENLKLKKELEEMDDAYFDNKHKIIELTSSNAIKTFFS